ncbi:Rho GTPase (Miro-like) [Legionella steigerwaltii]|uniref:Rho GTPase (Miro-like) n=1 Tax=Legionella steigerwaltii TaxID=460 RepID=A0A378L830_9GAMM|nr:Rab family GTPase [Legionella steigerwaltii]KTD77676.1 Rho GTPase (Miro-like) [Legionella steigerwaltii]STY22986.1 Rho GTPase (Miro-like) [Legionella steigerwaltii]
MKYKVVVFGKQGSGKTRLNHKIAQKEIDFEEDLAPTLSVDFLSRKIDSNNVVDLWDISGEERFKQINPYYYKGADVGVFCVDLTEEIKEQEITSRIQEFRQFAPLVPIICVGTKSDSSRANSNALEKIKSKELFTNFIITSANNGDNVEALFDLIRTHCEGKLLLSWSEAVTKLKKSIISLPKAKNTLIGIELDELSNIILNKTGVPSVTPKEKAAAIEKFTKNCEIILGDEHPNVLKAVLAVAAAAIVLTVTALIGFAIGVAYSWWTGPGAFFAGLLSGYTAAVTVASSSALSGVITGGITAYGLFKPSTEVEALANFTAEVSSWDKSVIL